METLLFVLHIFSCLFLVGLILLQGGKGADMGAAFGGASQTVFGSRGPATFLNKFTIVIAVIFLSASLILANMAKTKSATSVIDQAAKQEAVDTKDAEAVIEEEPAAKPVEEKAEEATEKKEAK